MRPGHSVLLAWAIGLLVADTSAALDLERPSVSNLLVQLASSNAQDRMLAIRDLGETSSPEIATALAGALTETNNEVRRAALQGADPTIGPGAAARSLGLMKPAEARETLALAAQSATGAVPPSVILALAAYDDPRAAPGLAILLRNPDADYLPVAIAAAARLNSSEAVPPLFELMKSRSAQIARAAEQALRSIRNPAAVPAYGEALGDVNLNIRAIAAEMLGAIRDPLAIEPLIKAGRDQDVRVRRCAVESLSKFKDARVTAAFLDMIRSHPDGFARRTAAQYLGGAGDPAAVDKLIFALLDDDATVREQAVGSLAYYPGPKIVEPLIQTFEDSRIQAASTRVIQALPPALTRAPLFTAATNPALYIRAAAVALLAPGQDDQVTEMLLSAMKDEQGHVRSPAIEALVARKEPRANEILIERLTNASLAIRQESHAALKTWHGQDFGPDPEEWRIRTQPHGLFPKTFPIGNNWPVAVAKLGILLGLLWLLKTVQQPLLCAFLYTVAYIFLCPFLGLPALLLVRTGVAAIALATLYFWLLYRFAGETLIWWPVLLGGILLILI